MSDESKITIFLTLGTIVFFLSVWWLSIIYNSFECRSKWSSFQNRYRFIQGCQIEVNKKWIPADSYYFKEE